MIRINLLSNERRKAVRARSSTLASRSACLRSGDCPRGKRTPIGTGRFARAATVERRSRCAAGGRASAANHRRGDAVRGTAPAPASNAYSSSRSFERQGVPSICSIRSVEVFRHAVAHVDAAGSAALTGGAAAPPRALSDFVGNLGATDFFKKPIEIIAASRRRLAGRRDHPLYGEGRSRRPRRAGGSPARR